MSIGKRKSLCLESDPQDRSLYPRPAKLSKKKRTDEYADTLGEQKIGTKVKRQVWTPTSIDAFFEGLCQHGKSFHGILHYMQAKFKKKNDPTIPNLTKDQVRFFYYRTWHKVSIMLGECSTDESSRKQLKLCCEESSPPPLDRKFEDAENPLDSSADEMDTGEGSPLAAAPEHNSPSCPEPNTVPCLGSSAVEKGKENPLSVVIPDDKEVKKEMSKDTVMVNGKSHSVDLVALICYHKLRKKCPEQVIGRKLRELVYQGYTTIREKGKRKLQVKIPNCRALRGTLHSVDLPPPTDGAFSEPEPLTPTEECRHIVVELRPRSIASWVYVQGLAQNPRVRLMAAATKPISEIVHYLALKWHLNPSKAEDMMYMYHTYNTEPTAAGGDTSQVFSFACQKVPSESNAKQRTENKNEGSTVQLVANEAPHHMQDNLMDKVDLVQAPGPVISTCVDPGILTTSGATLMSLPSAPKLNVKETKLLVNDYACTLEDLYCKFLKPIKLQFLYDFPNKEDACVADATCNTKLATVCRIVEFIGRCEENRQTVVNLATPVTVADSVVQSSPKRIGYVKLLPKRSPWKSPLSKYQRLKNRSPLKQMSVRRTRLNFSLAPSSYAMGSLPTVLSQEQSESLAPLISLSTDEPQPCVPVSCTSESLKGSQDQVQIVSSSAQLGSVQGFSSISLNSMAAHPTAGSGLQNVSVRPTMPIAGVVPLDRISAVHVPQSQFSLEPLEINRSLPATSYSIESTGSPSSFHVNLSGQSRVIVSPLVVEPSPKNPVDAGRDTSRGPDVFVKPLSSLAETAVSSQQSPLLQFATNSLGTRFSEKSIVPHITSTQQVPIVAPLKPYSKSKRVKKAQGKSIHTRQLVPRPLSFLSNPSPLASVQSPKSAVATSVDTAPQVNPALSSQPNSSSVHVSQLSNAPQVLALLQSLLHQQQLISASNQALQTELPKQGTEHVIRDRVTSLGLPEHISSNSMTATDENDAPLYPETSGSAEIFNTSSDTVNELLRGLSSHPNDQSLQKLCHDTADVLPSFAKAIVSLENKSLECAPPSDSITSISAPILSEEASLSGIMDQGELLELAGVFSQLQTPEKSRQQTSDGDVSITELLNIVDCTSERRADNTSYSSADSTFRSLLDDSSVDYIQKFRDIASKMNQSSL